MAKLLSLAAMLCLALFVSSCSSNTPTAVAEKSIECIKDQKFDEYVELIYVKPSEKEDAGKYKKEKEQFAAMLQEKYAKTLEKNGGIKSYKIISEEIAEDGETAVVMVKITNGNGSEEDDTIKLRKDDEGNWKIDMGK